MRFPALLALLLPFFLPIASEGLRTPSGKLKGAYLEPSDSQLKCPAFLGVPFAEPPTGELRFRPTQPLKSWQGTLEAVSFPAGCTQMVPISSMPGKPEDSEDCLYLNIILPPNDLEQSQLKPVMMWIHGGYFLAGSSSDYSPEETCRNLASKGVIVVTIQYRLGYFGFLSTGDEAAPGNWALYDQIEALK